MSETPPDRIEQFWRRVLLYRQNGQHARAANLLLELSTLAPSARIYSALAEEYRVTDEIGRAFAAYKLALQEDPHDVSTMFGLGALLTSRGRHEDACEVYCFALKCEPELPEAHVNLGSTMARLGNFDEAEVCYLNAFRYASDTPLGGRILYNLARVCAYTDRPDGAIDGLICAGVRNEKYALRGCLDHVFHEARQLTRFERVVILAERPVYAQLTEVLKRGGGERVREYLRTYPYIREIIQSRPAYEKFRGFLLDRHAD